jgi:hypothetical protein
MGDPPGRQLFIGEHQPEANRMTQIVSRGWVKPRGGLWTATYLGPRLGSAWVQWCLTEGVYVPNDGEWSGWLLTPRPGIRVATIDTHADLEALYRRYPDDYAPHHPKPAWYALAADLDAVHLTAAGEAATRFTYPLTLYGFDCETWLWFRWCFESVEPVTGRYELAEQEAP